MQNDIDSFLLYYVRQDACLFLTSSLLPLVILSTHHLNYYNGELKVFVWKKRGACPLKINPPWFSWRYLTRYFLSQVSWKQRNFRESNFILMFKKVCSCDFLTSFTVDFKFHFLNFNIYLFAHIWYLLNDQF